MVKVEDLIKSKEGESQLKPVAVEKGLWQRMGDFVNSLPKSEKKDPAQKEVILSLIGALLAIGILCFCGEQFKSPLLWGPFGATAVLVFGAYQAPLAQPRNVVLGHFFAVSIGTCVYYFFGSGFWSIAIGVSLAIIMMLATYSVHPPAGATAFVTVQTGGLGQGFWCILNPVLIGALAMVAMAIIFSKITGRKYPVHWW